MKKLLSVFLATVGLTQAQAGAVRRTVAGLVIDAQNGSPVRRAKISLHCVKHRGWQETIEVLSGANGEFTFTNLPSEAGDVFCTASVVRVGYLPLTNVSAGANRLELKLIPQSVIGGTVLDENGRPVPMAQVQVLQQILKDGSYKIVTHGQGGTDDRGRFRIAELNAGAYRVCIEVGPSDYLSSQHLGYGRTCVPNASDSGHWEGIELRTGGSTDLRVDVKPVRSIRIAGHVLNSPGNPSVELFRIGDEEHPEGAPCNWYGAASRFECLAIVPGEYWINVSYTTADTRLTGGKPVTVASSDITGLELKLGHGSELLGRVTPGDWLASGKIFGLRFTSVRWDSAMPATPLDSDGIFRVVLARYDSYRVGLTGLLPWHIQSIRQAGKDITDSLLRPQPDGSWGSIEITVSQSHGSLDGAVHQPSGEDSLVRIIHREDGLLTLFGSYRVSREQPRFHVENIPPGEYLVLASTVNVELPYLDAAYLLERKDVAQVRIVDGKATHLEIDTVSNASHIKN